jgi:CHAT domain-containing protein/tetratricopeptide (TPR) repeat protein
MVAPALPAAAPGTEPAKPPLTREQQDRLKERERLQAEVAKQEAAGRLVEAIAAARKKLALERQVFGEVHEDVAGTLGWLARLCQQQEDFAAARQAAGEALAICTKLDGPKHWRTTDARLALAHVERLARMGPPERRQLQQADRLMGQVVELYRAGRYAEAVKPCRQALDIRRPLLGEQDRRCADCLASLGSLYERTRDYAQAETLQRRALEIRKAVLGDEHPAYATSLNNLAVLYADKGAYAEAEALYTQALAVRRKAQGEKHPDYLFCLRNLAGLCARMAARYRDAEDFARAADCWRRVAELKSRVLGERHWEVTDARLALADAERLSHMTAAQRRRLAEARRLDQEARELRRQGRAREGVEPARRVLEIRRQELGQSHPDYGHSLNHLALLYAALGEYARAEPLYEQAREVFKRVLGEQHPEYATVLSNLAVLCDARGEYTRAKPLFEKALEIHRQALGERHPSYATTLNNLAMVHVYTGEYVRAKPLLEKSLEIRKQALGEGHRDYALALNNLAGLYEAMADYASAERLYRQALEVRRRALGERHPDYAASLSNLAGVYESTGRYARAESLYQEAQKIRRQALGERHPDYALGLNNLATLYMQRGEYAKAEEFYRQALNIRAKVLGERHPNYASSLSNLGLLYDSMGEYDKAELFYRRALEIRQQALGKRHPDYAVSLNNLANLYQSLGDYARAESLYRQARDVKRQALGEQHPAYATSLNNLAELYREMGDYPKAEPLYRRALQIYMQTVGPYHSDYASCLHNLARLYCDMRDYLQAEPLYRQALQARHEALGERHPDYAESLNNLAVVYESTLRYAEAEPLYQKALRIVQQTLGERHPACASTLNNLGVLYKEKGECDTAMPFLRRALEIQKQAPGDRHPDYALTLHNLAALYDFMGDHTQAEPLFRRALDIYERTLGEHHPRYGNALANLAALYWSEAVQLQLLAPQAAPLHGPAALYGAAIDMGRAERLLRRALDLSRAGLELAAAAQSQRQQLVLLGDQRRFLDAYLSVASQAQQPAAAQYRPVLAWKGSVGRRQRYQHLARKQPELAGEFAELDRVASRLAALALAGSAPKDVATHRRRVQELTEQKERLEADLARKSAAFRTQQQLKDPEPARLQAALPADAVLLDFLEYVHRTPAPGKKDRWQRQRRLVAFVVRRDALVRVDLGPARPVREAVGLWRQALQRHFRTEGDTRLGAAVRRLIWRPLEGHLKGARLVLVSPDGVLAEVPFAALPGSKKDSYLLEEVALATVPVPQLLPEMLADRPGAGQAEPSLLVLGDVRYDAAVAGEAVADSRAAPRGEALGRWPALEATRAEVAAIRDSFQRRFRKGLVTDLREDEATEAAVRKEAPAHRYLHLATHGFFAPRQLQSALADVSRGGRPEAGDLFTRQGVAGFHPGLLSGLVLAGANRPADPEKDDGILTALEVEALDLSGVELAVLSACQTGLGEEAGGEGLLGLQRAFQLAGARSVVASLWQVDDKATRELMVRFYENLWKRRMSKLEALRAAQLWMLQEGAGRGMVDVRVPRERLPVEDGRLAPYYWAAFVLSGDWR